MFNRRPQTLADRQDARSLSSPMSLTLMLAGSLAALALTGCGAGLLDSSTTPLVTPSLSGSAFGGAAPVVGTTVKMYATGNSAGLSTGYGVATMLQEAVQKGASAGQDTDANGNFHFAGGYNCPAGQFAYIVAGGGNSGGNSVNNNLLLVAALGRCEDLYNNVAGTYTGYKGGTILINELSTVAAAYALGHFSTVTGSGTGGGAAVLIGAPATNNAAQVSGTSTGCVSGVGACTLTAAAGLAHAFENAANLVNVFSSAGEGSNAYAALPGNANAVVPQQLINTIGNILISCVNSTGGTAGGSNACGDVFAATTIGSNVPADTYSATVNLAANPTLSGSPAAVTSLFNVALPASSIYQPALSSSTGLNDFSVAISYPASSFSAISFPMSGALDINDNFYAGNATYNTSSAGNPTTPVDILSFSSNGATYGVSAANSTLKAAYGLSLDALGNGYIGNGGGSGTSALGVFASNNGVTGATALTTAGIVTTAHSGNLKVYALAVDQANDVWALGVKQTNGTSNLYMNPGPYTPAATTWVASQNPAITLPSSNTISLAIDPNQNVWSAASTTVYVVENNGTVAAPTYTNASVASGTSGGSPATGLSFVPNGGSYQAYASAYNTTPGLQPFVPTFDTNTIGVSSITPGTLVQPASETGSLNSRADGAGTIWLADTNSVSLQQFLPSTGAAYKLLPCIGGSTTCTPAFALPAKPQAVSIDSTGSIWVASAASGSTATTATPGTIVEIIGAASPTWPLLSLGKIAQP